MSAQGVRDIRLRLDRLELGEDQISFFVDEGASGQGDDIRIKVADSARP